MLYIDIFIMDIYLYIYIYIYICILIMHIMYTRARQTLLQVEAFGVPPRRIPSDLMPNVLNKAQTEAY